MAYVKTGRKNKPGAGRPRKQEPVTAIRFRIENDLHAWLKANKGDKSVNQLINDIIRKEIGL